MQLAEFHGIVDSLSVEECDANNSLVLLSMTPSFIVSGHWLRCRELEHLDIFIGIDSEMDLDELYDCVGQNCPFLETLNLEVGATVNIDLMAKFCNSLLYLKNLRLLVFIEDPTIRCFTYSETTIKN